MNEENEQLVIWHKLILRRYGLAKGGGGSGRGARWELRGDKVCPR